MLMEIKIKILKEAREAKMDSSLKTPKVKELFSEKAIQTRVKQIAKKIAEKYLPSLEQEGKNFRLLFVGILKGGEPFASDLVREISRVFPSLYVRKDYVSIASRDKNNKSGDVRLLLDLRGSIQNIHVVIVEDIVDTGATMGYLLPQLLARNPASLELCALIDKTPGRKKKVKINYTGFKLLEPIYVVGYGLDSKERYRGLPFIGYIENEQD